MNIRNLPCSCKSGRKYKLCCEPVNDFLKRNSDSLPFIGVHIPLSAITGRLVSPLKCEDIVRKLELGEDAIQHICRLNCFITNRESNKEFQLQTARYLGIAGSGLNIMT